MDCRPDCGACCIEPSITSPIPGMPSGKPTGVRCVQLDDQHHCRIFASEERPAVCCNFPPHPDVCGSSRAEARQLLRRWEVLTA